MHTGIFDRICQQINNTGRKPVMLNGVLILLLRLILDCDANLDLGNPGFFFDRYFWFISFLSYLSEKWVNSALKMIRDVAGSKGELILYFKSKFWAWVGKLRANSVHRVLFHSLRQLSKLRRAHFKIVYVGRNFVRVESRNLFGPLL